MNDNSDKQKAPESEQQNTKQTPGISDKKGPLNKEVDTAPDEFIGSNADTDQPIDGQVINDTVLRGEPTADDSPQVKPPTTDNGK